MCGGRGGGEGSYSSSFDAASSSHGAGGEGSGGQLLAAFGGRRVEAAMAAFRAAAAAASCSSGVDIGEDAKQHPGGAGVGWELNGQSVHLHQAVATASPPSVPGSGKAGSGGGWEVAVGGFLGVAARDKKHPLLRRRPHLDDALTTGSGARARPGSAVARIGSGDVMVEGVSLPTMPPLPRKDRTGPHGHRGRGGCGGESSEDLDFELPEFL